MKLLLVDDDPMIHRLVDFALREEGYELIKMDNGFQAKKWLENHHDEIHAMVLDWEMPGMSGLDLLSALKKEDAFKDIPVVMLTAYGGKSDIQRGIEAGAYYYLTKPFNKDFLCSILRRAVYDYQQLLELKHKLSVSQNPLSNMLRGIFEFRTLQEAQKLSILIANASKTPDKALLICELLNNAVEHGNLGIGYEEKTRLIEQNRLVDEIMERLNKPEYRNKCATVEIIREKDVLKVVIKDQGNGFDYNRYLEFDSARMFDNHGRGIAIARSMLDIQYIGKGNVVQAIIPIEQSN
ncbi:MAG: hypothetical protein KatS3mg031_2120 [Chitinophagales bacterium]|nr:MAG: hypothetical protein KatS3mg031_2120 [Chitinophagales bacterium]